jgi:hypothetical protein
MVQISQAILKKFCICSKTVNFLIWFPAAYFRIYSGLANTLAANSKILIMKKAMQAVFAIMFMLVLAACNSKEGENATFKASPGSTDDFTAKTWHISNFYKDDRQQKNSFAAYTFRFMPNNRLMVTNGAANYIGKWSVINDAGTDDSPPADTGFVIEFTNRGDISTLNGEWMIVDFTFSALVLSNLNTVHDGTDYLTFEKS